MTMKNVLATTILLRNHVARISGPAFAESIAPSYQLLQYAKHEELDFSEASAVILDFAAKVCVNPDDKDKAGRRCGKRALRGGGGGMAQTPTAKPARKPRSTKKTTTAKPSKPATKSTRTPKVNPDDPDRMRQVVTGEIPVTKMERKQLDRLQSKSDAAKKRQQDIDNVGWKAYEKEEKKFNRTKTGKRLNELAEKENRSPSEEKEYEKGLKEFGNMVSRATKLREEAKKEEIKKNGRPKKLTKSERSRFNRLNGLVSGERMTAPERESLRPFDDSEVEKMFRGTDAMRKRDERRGKKLIEDFEREFA